MTYIIGDVHGEFDSLRILADKFLKDSKLIFVGDLVDRGKKSNEVVNFVKSNNHLCVLGNHEKMMIEYVREFEKTYPNLPSMVYYHRWIYNGGKQTLLSYEVIKVDKSDGKLVCLEDEKEEVFEEYALWNKKEPKLDVPIFNIFGHTIQKEVDLTKHFINIDTGCCYTKEGYGKLSAYCVELNEVVST